MAFQMRLTSALGRNRNLSFVSRVRTRASRHLSTPIHPPDANSHPIPSPNPSLRLPPLPHPVLTTQQPFPFARRLDFSSMFATFLPRFVASMMVGILLFLVFTHAEHTQKRVQALTTELGKADEFLLKNQVNATLELVRYAIKVLGHDFKECFRDQEAYRRSAVKLGVDYAKRLLGRKRGFGEACEPCHQNGSLQELENGRSEMISSFHTKYDCLQRLEKVSGLAAKTCIAGEQRCTVGLLETAIWAHAAMALPMTIGAFALLGKPQIWSYRACAVCTCNILKQFKIQGGEEVWEYIPTDEDLTWIMAEIYAEVGDWATMSSPSPPSTVTLSSSSPSTPLSSLSPSTTLLSPPPAPLSPYSSFPAHWCKHRGVKSNLPKR